MTMRVVLALALIASAAAVVLRAQQSGAAADARAHNVLTAEEKAAGWRLLFDGRTANGWRGYRQQTIPAGWQAIDGTLTRIGAGGDIITVDQFADFELAIDWKVNPGGNSGIFYRVSEEPAVIWHGAPEFQLLDDAAHPGAPANTLTGSNYALHAPVKPMANPPGAWNHARVLVRGNHVEHWLNGVKTVEYELGSAEWKRLVQASKFKEHPSYGTARRGHIGLQDHGDSVSFRNIKIRPLP